MSKTDKENKENSTKTDITNTANYEQDFSYPNTEYYTIKHFSLNPYDDCSILRDINEAKNLGFVFEYMYSKNQEYENASNITQQDKADCAKYISESIEQHSLQEQYNKNIKTYKSRIKSLEKLDPNLYKQLIDIIGYAENTSKEIFDKYYDEIEIIENMNDNLIANLLLKKLSEIVIDTFFSFLSQDNDTNAVEEVGDSTRRLARKFAGFLRRVPYIGWAIIAFDIGLLVWDYIKSTQGYDLAKKYTILKCFYTQIDNESSIIIHKDYIERDYYYKKSSNDSYCIGSYNYNVYKSMDLLQKRGFRSKIFYILLNIDFYSYYTNILNMDNTNYRDMSINYNNIAQLSFYSTSKDITESSYFHHIQKLLLNSFSFVLIQTSMYSSALVNEILKSSYSKNNINTNSNKYTVIISNSQNINNFQYKSQQYCFSNLKNNHINGNIVCFYTSYKINTVWFYGYYTSRIDIFLNNIIYNYLLIKPSEYYVENFNLVTDLVFKRIFQVDSSFISGFTKDSLELYFDMRKNFFIKNTSNILDGFTQIVMYYKTAYLTNYTDEKYRSAFEEINNYMSYENYPDYKNYLYSIYNFFEYMRNICSIIDNFYVQPKDSKLQEYIEEYRNIKQNELNVFFNSSSDDKSIESCIKKDDNIKQICENIINTEYSLDFQNQQIQAKNNFEEVITNQYRDDFNQILLSYKEYLIEIVPSLDGIEYSDLFNISQETIDEFVFKKLKLYLYQKIKNKLPVTIIDIERIYGDKEYYNRICEYIYVKYFQQLYGENNTSDEVKTNVEYISKKYLMPVSTHMITQEFSALIIEYIEYLLSISLQNNPFLSIKDLFQNPKKLFETYKFDISEVVNLYSKQIINNLFLFSCISLFDDSLFTDNKSSSQGKEQEQNDNENNSVDDEYVETAENILKDADEENPFIRFAFDALSQKIQEQLDITKRFELNNIKDTLSYTSTGLLFVLKLFNTATGVQDLLHLMRGLLHFIDINSIPEFLWSNRSNLFRVHIGLLLNDQLFTSIERDIEKDLFYQKLAHEDILELVDDAKRKLKEDTEAYKQYVVTKFKKFLASMRYIYYTIRVRLHSSDYSNNKYDIILNKYVTRSLAKLYNVNMKDINYITRKTPHMHYVFTLNDIVIYKKLDHVNSYGEFIEEYKKYTKYHKSTSTSNLSNGKNPMKSKLVLGLGNVTASFIVETYIDQQLPIIVKDEYDRNNSVIEFAYTNNRMDNFGCIWNEDKTKNFFTIPKDISQNFIMSDFRAMVVGGAHFDNNCFIQGTSSGIFVQDNEKVTRSFLEIILDYIDVVKEQQFDVKMGKYLVAYYKVINYLYKIHNYYSISLGKLNILYKNLSRIEEFINSNNLIQKNNRVDNENTQKINNNNSQTIDNSLMKDFVIQLKRIGESNYKFYETQMPAKKGQASNNNDNSKERDVQEAQSVQDNSTATATATATATTESDNNSSIKIGSEHSGFLDNDEMPVLLGSLIYDERWFKSTIDDE